MTTKPTEKPKTRPTAAAIAKKFNVSLPTVTNWQRRGAPIGPDFSFDPVTLEVWRWFQEQKHTDPFWREHCAKSSDELLEDAHRMQGRLSFWFNANRDWKSPNHPKIKAALLKISEAICRLEELA